MTVGEAWAAERPLLRPLPADPFDAAETATPRVDAKSLVTVRQNRYSVPVCLAGLRVSVRIGAREITVSHGGTVVARHERLQGRYGTSAQLDHYLELLERKPGGLEHSLALRQERERGAWPACFDELWAALTVRYGSSEAARQMVDVVMLSREHDPARVELAVQGALAAGAHDGRAVAVLARRADATGPAPAPLEQLEPRLAVHARPAPDLAEYNAADRRRQVTANAKTAALEALIDAHAVELKLPTVRRRFRALAAEATREQQTPVAYLGALLEAEMNERAERRERRRLNDARFPQIKRLDDFHFADNPKVPQATIAALAEGSWIDDRESVILIGDSGTGKTHLATALAVCACQAGRRVRFTTLAGLANELQEAEGRRELARVVARYARTELVVLDELGYLAPARRRRRARLPGPLRTPRTRQPDRDHQPPLRRMDQGLPRPTARQSRRRPAHPPRPHHRHRHRILALPPRPHPEQTPPPTPARMTRTAPRYRPSARLRLAPERQRGAPSAMNRKTENPTAGGATSDHHGGASASHHGEATRENP